MNLECHEKLVSVIVPVYKAQDYIEQCVKSIIAQDYPNIEIVLVDDCSPDNCGVICDKFSEEYQIIQTIHLEHNSGTAIARNEGIKKSRGDFICFVDSDDYIDSNYVSALMGLLLEHSADIAVSAVRREYENKPKKKIKRNPVCVDSRTVMEEVYFYNSITWSPCGKLFRRSIFGKQMFRNVRKYEDFYSMQDFVMAADKIVVDNGLDHYHYICREGSNLTGKLSDDTLSVFDMSDEIANKSNQFVHDERIVRAEMYRAALLQILNLASMNDVNFSRVFLLKRDYLRKSLMKYMMLTDVSATKKLTYLALCSSPKMYKRLRCLVNGR